ncbi:MAG: hypothetical protein ACLFUK_04705 [Halanaerobium sp.]
MTLMAQDDDYIYLNDYDLDLTIEKILKGESSSVIDISGEIDLGIIKIILGELEEVEDYEKITIRIMKKITSAAVLLKGSKNIKPTMKTGPGRDLQM